MNLDDLKTNLVKRGYKSDFVSPQFSRVRNCKRSKLLRRDPGRVRDRNERAVLVLNHPALLDVLRIIKEMQILVNVTFA